MSAKKVLAEDLKQRAHKETKAIESATSTAEALRKIDLKMTAKAGKEGKLFGAITNVHVTEKLNELGTVWRRSLFKSLETPSKLLASTQLRFAFTAKLWLISHLKLLVNWLNKPHTPTD